MRAVVYTAIDQETAFRLQEWMREFAPSAFPTLIIRPVMLQKRGVMWEMSADVDSKEGILMLSGMMMGAQFGWQKREEMQAAIEEQERREAKKARKKEERAQEEHAQDPRDYYSFLLEQQNLQLSAAAFTGSMMQRMQGVPGAPVYRPMLPGMPPPRRAGGTTTRQVRAEEVIDVEAEETTPAPARGKGKGGAAKGKPPASAPRSRGQQAPPQPPPKPWIRALPPPKPNLFEGTFDDDWRDSDS